MKHLYLDNFRGFSDTFVPITDVNFLVGENSTGKTSVLGLLHLISSQRFWFQQNFDMEDVRFGHFRDIVSVHADNRNYFRIGFVGEDKRTEGAPPQSKQTSQLPLSFLATYKEHEGLPIISRFTFNAQDLQHTLKFTGTGVFYKSEAIVVDGSADKTWTKIIGVWVNEHRIGKSGYRKLPIPEGFPNQESVNLFFALAFVRNISMVSESKSKSKSKPKSKSKSNSKSKSKRSGITFSLFHPTYLEEIVWLAPIRTQPRRTYDEVNLDYSPEGTHTPYVIRKILDSKTEAAEFLSFMQSVGKSSGLFDSIGIKRYGKGVTAPFEVDIILEKKALSLSNVGYGVSQFLPVLVELLIRQKGTWFAVQQPEVHLHPQAQAVLGDVLFDLAVRERKCFLVETHSDFAIDRFRMNFRRRQRRQPHAQVLFFERKDARNIVWSLPIGKNGELPRKQPVSYRRFFMKEQLRSLGI